MAPAATWSLQLKSRDAEKKGERRQERGESLEAPNVPTEAAGRHSSQTLSDRLTFSLMIFLSVWLSPRLARLTLLLMLKPCDMAEVSDPNWSPQNLKRGEEKAEVELHPWQLGEHVSSTT